MLDDTTGVGDMGKPVRMPTYRRHATGQGLIVLSGQYHYCGLHGTPEAQARAEGYLAAWIAGGYKPLKIDGGATVGDVADRFAAWAEARFRKRGGPTTYAKQCRRVMAMWAAAHGSEPADGFGPKTLRVLRHRWFTEARRGGRTRCRNTVNLYTGVVIEAMRWAASEELVPAAVHAALASLGPLSARDGGRGSKLVVSASPKAVAGAMAALPRTACDILTLMQVSGMRPAEACVVAVEHLERTDPEVWIYRVPDEWYKSEHAGKHRIVFLGPKARAILQPRIERYKSGPLFRPSAGTRRNSHYLPTSLASILCDYRRRLGLDDIAANQMRHGALTAVHAHLGLEHARGVAGHSSAKTTLIYVDPDVSTADDRRRAREAALAIG